MSEILSIKELLAMAMPIVDIPGFTGKEPIKVKLQKPRIMTLAAQGKIPNPLMGIATKMIKGEMTKSEFNLKDSGQMMELYCRACMVEPTYEEMKDLITDDQVLYIFNWAMGGVKEIETFRADEKDGTDNNNGEEVPEKA